MDERRFVQVRASLEFWQEIITTGWKVPCDSELGVECVEGLPEGAKLVKVDYMWPLDAPIDTGGIITFIFEHETFDSLLMGESIPTITPMFKRHYKD